MATTTEFEKLAAVIQKAAAELKPNNFYRDSVHDLLARNSCDSECNDYAIRYEVGYDKGQAHLSDLEKGTFVAIHKDNFLKLLATKLGGNQKKAASTLKKMIDGTDVFKSIQKKNDSDTIFISSEDITSLQDFLGKDYLNFIFDAGDFVPFPHYRVASSPFDSASTPENPTNTGNEHTLYGFSNLLYTKILNQHTTKSHTSVYGKKKKSKKSKSNFSRTKKTQKGGSGGGAGAGGAGAGGVAATGPSYNDKALIALRIFWFCILYYLDKIPYMKETGILGIKPTKPPHHDDAWKDENINPVLFFLSFLKIENISSKTQMFCRIRAQGAPYEVVGIEQTNMDAFRLNLAGSDAKLQTWTNNIPFSGQFPFEISQSLMATIIHANSGQAKPRSDDGKFGNTSNLVELFKQWLIDSGFTQQQKEKLTIIFCRIMKFLGDKAHIILGIIMIFLEKNSLILTGDRPLLGSCINEINHLNSVSDIKGSLSVMIKFVNELEGLTKYQQLLTDIQASNLPLSDFLIYYKYTKQNAENEWQGLKKSVETRLQILIDTNHTINGTLITSDFIKNLIDLRYPDIAHTSAPNWKKPIGAAATMPDDPCKISAGDISKEPWKSDNKLKELEKEAKKLNNKKLLETKITLLTVELSVINSAKPSTNAYLYKNGVFFIGGRVSARSIGINRGFRSISNSSPTQVKNDLQVYSSLLNGFCGILENINDGIANGWLDEEDIQLYSSCIKNTDDAFVVASDVGGDGEIVKAFNVLKAQIKQFNLYKIAKLVVINYMLVLALKQTEFGLSLTDEPNKLKLTEEYHKNILDNLSQLSSLILFQGPPNTKLPQNDVVIVINLLNSLFEVSVKIIKLVNNLSNSGAAGSCDGEEEVLKMTIEPLSDAAGGAASDAASDAAASGSKGRRQRKSSNKNKKKKKQSGGADAGGNIGDVDKINFKKIIKVQHAELVKVKSLSVDDIEITIPKAKNTLVWSGEVDAKPGQSITTGDSFIIINKKHRQHTSFDTQPLVMSIKSILTTDFSELCKKLNLLTSDDRSINTCMQQCIGQEQEITLNNLNVHINKLKLQFNEKCTKHFTHFSSFDGGVGSQIDSRKIQIWIKITETFLVPYIKFMEYFRHIYVTITNELNKLLNYDTRNRLSELNSCKRYLDHLLLNFSNIFNKNYLINMKGDSIEYYEEAEQDEPNISHNLLGPADPDGVPSVRSRRSGRSSRVVRGKKKSKRQKNNSNNNDLTKKAHSKVKLNPITKKKKK